MARRPVLDKHVVQVCVYDRVDEWVDKRIHIVCAYGAYDTLLVFNEEAESLLFLTMVPMIDERSLTTMLFLRVYYGACAINMDILCSLFSRHNLMPGSNYCSYIKIYGFQFSKEDHIKFIKLLYELIISPKLESPLLQFWCSLLKTLLKYVNFKEKDGATGPGLELGLGPGLGLLDQG